MVFRILLKKVYWLYCSSYSFSKQQDAQHNLKSATVRQPKANYFYPIYFCNWSSLSLILPSNSLFCQVLQFGLKNNDIVGLKISSKSERTISTLAQSSGVFPRSYFLSDILTMYLAMADDSVSLKSPLIKYGKLGKSRSNLVLSPLPNHFQGPLQVTSSQSNPVQDSSNLNTCPLPLIAQYPSLIFAYMSDAKDIIIRKGFENLNLKIKDLNVYHIQIFFKLLLNKIY